MLKGQDRYRRQAISFEPSVLLPPEQFVDLTDIVVPGIKPYYMISNYGRLWHKYKCEFLKVNIDSKGYLYKPLATIYGAKNYRVHRLVLASFLYIDGCEDLEVNHIDGNKANCIITNLEWCTKSENGKHAYDTGLNKRETLPDELVHMICADIASGEMLLKDIAEKYNVGVTLISAIVNKRTHCDISDNYDISSRKIASNFSTEQVHKICKFYEDHKPYFPLVNYYRDAVVCCGSKPTTLTIRSAQNIFIKKSYQYISKDYNF